ncbi:hypothetical protein MNEG_8450, partial [Monoraphidium neglectum]
MTATLPLARRQVYMAAVDGSDATEQVKLEHGLASSALPLASNGSSDGSGKLCEADARPSKPAGLTGGEDTPQATA